MPRRASRFPRGSFGVGLSATVAFALATPVVTWAETTRSPVPRPALLRVLGAVTAAARVPVKTPVAKAKVTAKAKAKVKDKANATAKATAKVTVKAKTSTSNKQATTPPTATTPATAPPVTSPPTVVGVGASPPVDGAGNGGPSLQPSDPPAGATPPASLPSAPPTSVPTPTQTTPTTTTTTTTATTTTATTTTATTTTATTTTTTTIPAPTTPAPAPTRANAASIEPYRGLGAWVDGLDWMACPLANSKGAGRCQIPKFTSNSVDLLVLSGAQTLFIQVTRTANPNDLPEQERFRPILDRARQLGLPVVGWYIPGHADTNLDLRRALAIASLDLDGITVDIESDIIKDLNLRNQRLADYATRLRQLLPGRVIGATILAPVFTDDSKNKLWPAFNPAPLAPFFDVWQIMGYFTDFRRRSDVPWRDAYLSTTENINRFRARMGRPDIPLHIIGGVGDNATAYDASRFVEAVRQTGGVLGASYYDWLVTKPDNNPYLWWVRRNPEGQGPDPRFQPAPFVAPTTTVAPTTIPPVPTAPIPTAPVPASTGPVGTVPPTLPTVTVVSIPTPPPDAPPPTG